MKKLFFCGKVSVMDTEDSTETSVPVGPCAHISVAIINNSTGNIHFVSLASIIIPVENYVGKFSFIFNHMITIICSILFKLLPLRKKDEEIRISELYSHFNVILLERITNFIMKTKMDIPDKEGRKRLVIVGGGFGGLKLARKLRSDKFQIVLLDKNNHHIFQPLLYQVATAGIEPSAISFPYRKIFKKRKHFHIRICEAQRVIPEDNILETSIGALSYDYLVVSTGCRTNYFGNDGLSQRTMALKNTAEALFNRNQILESFEKAQNTSNLETRKRLMTFVIVGGGATGIELSGALAEMKKFVLPQDYPDLDMNLMRIILVDGAPRLLSAFSEKSSEEVANYLLKRDVEIITSVQVTNYENGTMTLSDNSTLETMNVFWVAGVRANSIEGLAKEAYGPGNRLLVDLYNCVQGYNNIFAIGDTALMISKEYPKGHPQVVQPAIQQARNLIQNLDRKERGLEMQPFVYHNKGSMATIGRNHAVVELKNLRFGGFPAWAVWLFIHLMSIVGVKNRLFIFVDWMWSYFTYDPSLRVIIKPLRRDKP